MVPRPSPVEDVARVRAAFREFVENDRELPFPASGETWKRFVRFAACAAQDLSVARLAEGHADALAILAEARNDAPRRGAAYGVWAARTADGGTTVKPVPGGWELVGRKTFCSGAGMVDRALVTADAPDGYRLFDVATDEPAVTRDPDTWQAVGMAGSASDTVTFERAFIPDACAVGGPGFYTERPGFWYGAAGVASCWYGGAIGLVDGVVRGLGPDPGEHALADLGRAVTLVAAMRDVLHNAAGTIDADPADKRGLARGNALAARQMVHDGCLEVLARTSAAGGARPLCHDREQGRRAADLFVYLAQHHGGADAAELGRLVLGGWSWS